MLAILRIKHLARTNFSDFRNSYCTIDREAVRGRLFASTIFCEKWPGNSLILLNLVHANNSRLKVYVHTKL